MTRMELKEQIMKAGFEAGHLDETVLNAASEAASEANNGGLACQIEYLIGTCGWTEKDIMGSLKAERGST